METKGRYLQLQDIGAYQSAFALSNTVWNTVDHWNYFAKDTIGKQYVKAVDSIAANIAEGFGRFSKRDKIHFYRYSYGSIRESEDWTEKARIRGLLTEQQYQSIHKSLQILPRQVHHLIAFTNERLTI